MMARAFEYVFDQAQWVGVIILLTLVVSVGLNVYALIKCKGDD
jgi:hypothetical protein